MSADLFTSQYSNGNPAGTNEHITYSNVAAGASQSINYGLQVYNGASAPPDGTIIDLILTDQARAASVSRSVVVRIPAQGHLQLSLSSYAVGEGGGSVAIVVTRAGGRSGAVSATLSTSNGTATAGHDYTAVTNRVVNFADGDAADKIVNIPITHDTLVEGNETFTVTLTAPTGGVTLGTPSSAIVTTTDDDTVGTSGIAIEQPAGTPLSSGSSTVDFGAAILASRAPLVFTVKSSGTGKLARLAAKVTALMLSISSRARRKRRRCRLAAARR